METRGLAALESLAGRTRFGMKPGLDKIRELLEHLGNPHQRLAAIHIAGTNGKGAVAALCESVLRHAGYSVGRYTSPHLVRLNERFFINGEPISDEVLERYAVKVLDAVKGMEKTGEEITFFEALTALAFTLFDGEGIRLVVLETGLGGRLDATNVVTPLVSVITRIGLDHCDWLGGTVEEIAAEKAGIIMPGRPVVSAPMPASAREVIRKRAEEVGSPWINAEEMVGISSSQRSLEGQTLSITTPDRTLSTLRFPLAGAFQVENAATAVAALEIVSDSGLPLPDEAFVRGMQEVAWPGRFQLIHRDPPILVDGAHNPEGARALAEAFKSCRERRPVALVAGFCGDKDALGHLRTLAPMIRAAWAVPIPNPRTLPPERTAELMRMAGIRSVASSPTLAGAVENLKAWCLENSGVGLICGSLFLAGETLSLFGVEGFASCRQDPNERLKPL